jgi:UDP:flavonoid glycosyltransferase YjiC (YdhE family)
MFVLFSTNPYHGHFDPMKPLAQALEAAGHRVGVASTAGFASELERAGFQAFPSGIEPTTAWPWEEPVTRAKARDLIGIAMRVAVPDLIVREMTDFGAVVAAEALRIPHVTMVGGLSFFDVAWWRQLVGPDADRVRASYGLAPDPGLRHIHQHVCIDTTPRWFQTGPPYRWPTHRFYRVALDPHPVRAWNRSARQGTVPLVYVTLGTIFNQRTRLLRTILQGLASSAVDVLCTVGNDMDPQQLFPGGGPANIVIERYVPQDLVLPRCAAIVTHGGFSTLTGALRHAVPPLVIPLGADHSLNARRCVHLGIGRTLSASRLTPTAVRVGVETLIGDPAYRLHLQALRWTERAVPKIQRAVFLLEELANRGKADDTDPRPAAELVNRTPHHRV